MTALCATRPSDWWMVPDGGNRLALGLCSVCPALPTCGTDREYGVIRAGVAWDDEGRVLALCSCGRPEAYADRVDCYDCRPSSATQVPKRRRVFTRAAQHRHRRVASVRDLRMVALRESGVGWREIALEFGVPKSTVFNVVKRIRAQGSSTGVGG